MRWQLDGARCNSPLTDFACCVGKVQICTNSSEERETIRQSSLEDTTDLTPELWPASTFSVLLVKASHTCTDFSEELEMICLPSLEIATDMTVEVWPSSTFNVFPVTASHTRTNLSKEPETIHLSSLEKATDMTVEVWPLRLLTRTWSNLNNEPSTSFPFLSIGVPLHPSFL